MSTAADHEGQPLQTHTLPARLVHVTDDADRQRWREGFVGAYQTVFARAPYFERFTPAEAEGVWRRLTRIPDNITLVAVTPTDKVVGFGIAIPLRHQRDVTTRLAGLVDVPQTFYFAELGVLPEHRGQGLGAALVRGRLERLDRTCWSAVVLRASASRTGNLPLYTPMGFQEMGVTMEVSAPRVDGRVTTDRRLFLHGTVSQLRLDEAPVTP